MTDFCWIDLRILALRAFIILSFVFVIRETLWQTENAAVPEPPMSQHIRTDSMGKHVYFRPPNKHSKVMTLKDMPDLANATAVFQNETGQGLTTWAQALRGREKVVEILHRAGVRFDLEVLKILPLWSDVESLYGEEPVILGLEQCQAFREKYPLSKRFIGIAGQHNW